MIFYVADPQKYKLSSPPPTITPTPTPLWGVAIYFDIISNIAVKKKNYTFISRNMKQSARYGIQLRCYRNKLYVQTDSRIL